LGEFFQLAQTAALRSIEAHSGLPRGVVARRVAGQQRRWSFEAAGVRACFCDPDSHVYLPPPQCSLTYLPTQPAHFAGERKQERSGGYV
jgi:hypothetical protein